MQSVNITLVIIFLNMLATYLCFFCVLFQSQKTNVRFTYNVKILRFRVHFHRLYLTPWTKYDHLQKEDNTVGQLGEAQHPSATPLAPPLIPSSSLSLTSSLSWPTTRVLSNSMKPVQVLITWDYSNKPYTRKCLYIQPTILTMHIKGDIWYYILLSQESVIASETIHVKPTKCMNLFSHPRLFMFI